MMGEKYIDNIFEGNAVDVLKRLPPDIINCCITSPPYYGLRDYGHDGQIGLEKSPEAYIERLCEVFGEVRRVLRPDGTLWVVIGDCYSGSSKGAVYNNQDSYNKSNKGMINQIKCKDVGFGNRGCSHLRYAKQVGI